MKHRHYRNKKPKVIKPIAEGEDYCLRCMSHIESCQCLEWFECDDPDCEFVLER
jgi:hypothetical protein